MVCVGVGATVMVAGNSVFSSFVDNRLAPAVSEAVANLTAARVAVDVIGVAEANGASNVTALANHPAVCPAGVPFVAQISTQLHSYEEEFKEVRADVEAADDEVRDLDLVTAIHDYNGYRTWLTATAPILVAVIFFTTVMTLAARARDRAREESRGYGQQGPRPASSSCCRCSAACCCSTLSSLLAALMVVVAAMAAGGHFGAALVVSDVCGTGPSANVAQALQYSSSTAAQLGAFYSVCAKTDASDQLVAQLNQAHDALAGLTQACTLWDKSCPAKAKTDENYLDARAALDTIDSTFEKTLYPLRDCKTFQGLWCGTIDLHGGLCGAGFDGLFQIAVLEAALVATCCMGLFLSYTLFATTTTVHRRHDGGGGAGYLNIQGNEPRGESFGGSGVVSTQRLLEEA